MRSMLGNGWATFQPEPGADDLPERVPDAVGWLPFVGVVDGARVRSIGPASAPTVSTVTLARR